MMNLIGRVSNRRLFCTVKPTTFEDDYELIECLGQGSTARVYRSLDVRTNQQVIVKLFKKVVEHKIERESRMLWAVKSCPHVQQLKEIVQNVGFMNYGFVFEYYPGDTLNKFIKNLTLPQIKLYTLQLLMALRCLHSKGIMHRDIKPSNILISKEQGIGREKVVLLDFGLAEMADQSVSLKYKVGTNCYKPPEVLLKRTDYDEKIDIWGAGLILAEMLLKIKPLFKYEDDERDIIHKVMRRCQHAEEYITRQEAKDIGVQRYEGISENSLSEEGIKLALRMMDFNPKRRPSAEEVLKDNFFRDVRGV